VSLPAPLQLRFEAAVFDWDGTAVPDRRSDAERVRRLVEALCASGFDIGIVSGTHVGNVDGQLGARPSGPGALYLCLNRGSEVFVVEPTGPVLLHRRSATEAEEEALTAAARMTVARLAERGLQAELVADRLNRRKVDLIPEPAWADPPKARIAELLTAVETRLSAHGLGGLAEVADLARTVALAGGLRDPRVTSDVKHVEIGLTDKSDSARWLFSELGRRGIGPHAVLLGGDEFGLIGGLPGSDSLMLVAEAAAATKVSVGAEPGGLPPDIFALPGGPDAFVELLEDQERRRKRGELPVVNPDPEWTLVVEGLDPAHERAHASLMTLADGRIGTSGSPLLDHPVARRHVLVGGVYDGKGSVSRLLEGPVWSGVGGKLNSRRQLRRVLDLRAGVLFEEVSLADRQFLRSIRLSSLARPGTVVLHAEGPRSVFLDLRGVAAPGGRSRHRLGRNGGRDFVQVSASHGGVTAAARDTLRTRGSTTRLERLGAYVAGTDGTPEPALALDALRDAEQAGFERLLCEHRASWGEFWNGADIRIEGDAELQRNVRLALFHLRASAGRTEESAVGARGLTGPGYRGHVFWDTDVFVLPFLAATSPQAARTVLEYRLRRLPAALRAARGQGRRGARFPWESARTGLDVTPDRTRVHGERILILTGQLEEHIVADVAWGAACYLDWTGDEEFRVGPGLTLLVETARYWASRIRLDEDGRGHIEGVIGPDEYHEDVDDNAFTNVMARWNLRTAAAAAASVPGAAVEESEQARWLEVADALVDGYDPTTGVYEQFAGFSRLEPVVIAEMAERRPVDAERLLGRKRLHRAQVLKQTDVLMLHHLVPDEVAPDSLEPNLRFYEPRTAHGSTLSPGIHASLFARLGMTAEALEWLRVTSRIDLDNLTNSSSAGVHLAAMGSLWQALVHGFAGLRPAGDLLRLDPHVPEELGAIELGVRFRDSQVRARLEHGALTVSSDPPVTVLVGDRTTPELATPDGVRLVRRGTSWRRPQQ
jgi:trehalose/maltose hydrolase-like predicted phosphorylase